MHHLCGGSPDTFVFLFIHSAQDFSCFTQEMDMKAEFDRDRGKKKRNERKQEEDERKDGKRDKWQKENV